jgi:superfamily II DNA/RNA helicase
MMQCLLVARSSQSSSRRLLARRGLQHLGFVHQAPSEKSSSSSTIPSSSTSWTNSNNIHPAQNQRSSIGVVRRFLSSTTTTTETDNFFAEPSFESIGIKSKVLLERLETLGFTKPTVVQASSYKAISEGSEEYAGDVTIGAETGSGKTLAYLLPLIDDILQQKQKTSENSEDGNGLVSDYDYARAVILVPNKELVQQVLRMAAPLCGGFKNSVVWGGGNTNTFEQQRRQEDDKEEGADNNVNVDPTTVVRLAIMPGGLKAPMDFKPFRDSIGLGGSAPPVDLLISTPAAIGSLGLDPKHIDMFADIETIVIDEADMLLDGGYLRPLENVLMGFRRADRLTNSDEFGSSRTQHVFCAATLPDMGLRSVDAYLFKKFPYAERIHTAGMHNARHYGLKEPTVWYEVESKKERMEQLVDLLGKPVVDGGLKDEKVMVFLNSVEDVEGAQGAMERAGIASVQYHAKVPLEERSANLDLFRRYDRDAPTNKRIVPVLVCTDLAARGLDVPSVNAVVQLQFAGNVVAHLHRMGRCGRAGQRTGRGIVFYNEQESELVEVVRAAEEQQEKMVLHGDVDDVDANGDEAGKVNKAFSRKRGFTKKKKKLRREPEYPSESQ